VIDTQEIQLQTSSPTLQYNSTQESFAEYIRNRYKDNSGNCINYLINLSLSYYSPDQDYSVYEISQNLESAIIEKIEADITGQHEYSLKTDFDPIDGKHKVKFGQGWAEDIYNHAIDENNSQLPLFEINRNQANLKNLNTIQKNLNNEKDFKFVEFSPCPKITNEAKQRGYDGRDSIFVYTKNSNGEIEVKQYWYSAIDINDYTKLLNELGLNNKQTIEPETDLSVMQSSFIVESSIQLNLLENFIEDKSLKSKQESIELLNSQMDYIFNSCNEKVSSYKSTALDLLNNPDLDLSKELEDISQFILNKQLELRYLLWQNGTNTFSEQVIAFINEFKGLDGSNLLNMLSCIYTATGCGFSFSSSKNGFIGTQQSIPKSTHLFSFTTQSSERPDASVCQSCGRAFFVKNGDSSTYFSECPYCHNSIAKCE